MSDKAERMYCMCKEWLEGIQQIAAQAIFCNNQAAGPKYTATTFKYCPWCGKVLDPIQYMTDVLADISGSQEDWEDLVVEPYG